MTQDNDQTIAARKAQNTQALIQNYTEELKRDDLSAIRRRYAQDMLDAITSEEDGAVEKKREINAFWNEIEAQRDISSNKIDFLHETIEYLRELIIQVGNPDTSLIKKHDIIREVSNKNFTYNVRGRIKKRIREEENRIAEALKKKDDEHNKLRKEAIKRNS